MLNKRDQKKYDYALKSLPMNRFCIGAENKSIDYLTKVTTDTNRAKWIRFEAKQMLYMYEMITRETGLIDIVEIQKYWVSQQPHRKYFSKKWDKKDPNNYSYMPKPDRRDNKHTQVGSGSGGSNSIRYPKRKRKTAWKRFYKLFPNLNPENKKEEQ